MIQRLIHAASGEEIAARIEWAETRMQRVRGLLGRRPLEPAEALVIPRSPQIHTMGMRYPIAVVFCDGDWKVLRVIHSVRPWRVSPWVRGARWTVEMLVGRTGSIRADDDLALEPAGHPKVR